MLASPHSLSLMFAGDHSQRGCCIHSARAASCRRAAPMRPARRRAARRDSGVLPRPDPRVCASGHTAAGAACLASLHEQQRRALRRRRGAPDICHSHARLPAGTGAEAPMSAVRQDTMQRLVSCAAAERCRLSSISLLCCELGLCWPRSLPLSFPRSNKTGRLPAHPGITACTCPSKVHTHVVRVYLTSVTRPVTLTGLSQGTILLMLAGTRQPYSSSPVKQA